MPPRATWKGHLKLSLVNIAVRVYNATSSASRISLNQLHTDCHQRLRQKLHCPEHGEVSRDEITKGYEYEKGRYVVVTPDDIESLSLETTRVIEITQFVDRDELQPIYLSSPYYLAPDGPVADEAYRVVRTAMERSGKIGIGQFVVAGREHIVALELHDRGLMMTTVRAANEVRSAEPFFEEIGNSEIDEAQVTLAEQLIENSVAPLDTSIFRDRYQEALLDVIQRKLEGKAPEVVQEVEVAKTLNFMDALKASVDDAAKTRKKPPAKSVSKKTTKKKSRKKA